MLINCAILIASLFSFSTQGQDLVAGVSISDGFNKVKQQAIYRFTIVPDDLYFDAGTTIKTYLPSTISLQIGNNNAVSICQRFNKLTNNTEPLSSCSYNADDRMVQFTIPTYTSFDVAFQYEIGYIQNPSISSLVTGFGITIINQQNAILYDTIIEGTGVFIQPGDLLNQNLTVSSNKVSDSCTYTFRFQISNSMPGNGMIQITFPLNEIDVPSSISNSDTRVKVYGGSWQTGSIIASTRSITFQNPLQGIDLSPDSSQYIFIEIQKVVNPKSLKQTSSFQIATTDSFLNKIDQATTLMTVQPTAPGDITVFGVSPQTNPQVGQNTDLNFNIQLPQAYESGGYLLITFPTEVTIRTLNCYPYIGFVTQDSNCTIISSSPQTVKISNPISSQRLFFLISTVQNPSSNKNTSSFTIQAYDSSNFLMSQILSGVSYQATPSSIKSVSLVRSQQQINAQDGNNLTLTFTTTNPLVSGDQIFVKIPYDQQLVNSSNFACSIRISGVTTNPTCTLDTTSNSTYFIVYLQAPCSSGCAANSQFVLILSGIRNPQWKVSPLTRSVEIQTMTNDLLFIKDRRISSIFTTPELTEGSLGSINLQKNLAVVNQSTEYSLQFTLANSVPVNGFIRFYFPQNSTYLPTSGSIVCQDAINNNALLTCSAIQNSDTTRGIDYVQITNKCTSQCDAGSLISLKFSNLRNRASVKPIQNRFAIRTFTQESYNIDLGNITNATGLDLRTASFGSLSLLSPISPITTGTQGSYQFRINSSNGINATRGLLEIFFPSDISFSSSSLSCTATSNNQALTCSLNTSTKKITVSHTLSSSIFSGLNILIILQNGTINPQTTKTSNPFVIQTSLLDTDTSTYFLTDYDNTTLSVTADTPNTLNSVTVVRQNNEINVKTNFTIQFTITNPIPKNSLIIVSFPKDQVVFASSSSNHTFTDLNTNTQITEVLTNGINDQGTYYITSSLQEWCSNTLNACPAGSILKFQVSEVFNPSSTKPPSLSFQIKTETSDSYKIDQKVSDIFATPLLSNGPFQSISIAESNHIVGDLNTLTFTVKINNQITSGQNGTLLITFPSAMYYLQQSLSLSCSTESNTQTLCTSQSASSILGNYVTQVSINMQCVTLGCSSGATRIFSITNLRNRFSSAQINGSFQVQSLDSDNLTFDASTIDISTQSKIYQVLNPSNTGVILNVTRSNQTVNQATDLNIFFKANVLLQKSSIIQMLIPKEQFIIDADSTCKSSSNSVLSCQLNTQVENSTYYALQFSEFCSSTTYCPDNSTFGLVIKGFKNRYNTKAPQDYIKFLTYSPDLHSVETTSGPLLPANDLLPALGVMINNQSLSNTYVGEQTEFSISFNIQNNLYDSDNLNFTFTNSIFTLYQIGDPLLTYIQLANDQSTKQEIICSLNSQSALINCGPIPFNVTVNTLITMTFGNLKNLMEDKPISTSVQMTAYSSSSALISQGSLVIFNWDVLNPSQFQSLSAQRSTDVLGEIVDITIRYSNRINILQNSRLDVSIPKNQFVAEAPSSIIINFENNLIDTFDTLEDSNYLNLTTSSALCQASQCSSGNTYTIVLQGFKNPQQITSTLDPIRVRILSTNNYTIVNSTNTNIQASPSLKAGELYNVLVVQSGSLITGEETIYQFKFTLSNNLSTTTKLLIQFPSENVLSSSSQIQCKDINKQQNLNCGMNQTTNGYITAIVINNFCSVSTCNNQILQIIEISNLRNVEFQRQRTLNFTIMPISSDYFVLSTGVYSESQMPAFQIRSINTMQITRSSDILKATNVIIQISFTALNSISDGSSLTFTVPFEQVSFSSNAVQCFSSDNVNLNCQQISINSTHLVFKVQEWCSGNCPINYNFVLLLKNGINPQSLSANFPSQNIQLVIKNSQGLPNQQFNQKVTFTPAMKGEILTNILLSREINIVGIDDYMTLVIPINQTISESANLILNLPDNVAFESRDGTNCIILSRRWETVQCQYTLNTNSQEHGASSISKILFKEICNSNNNCIQSSNIILKFKVMNPKLQYKPSNTQFSVIITGKDYDIGQGQFNYNLNQMLPNNITSSIIDSTDFDNETAPCLQAGQKCIIKLAINTTNPVPKESQNGYLKIELPDRMTFQTNPSCDAYLNDDLISCKLVDTRTALIQHSLNINIRELEDLSFKYIVVLKGIQSPYSTESSENFTIQTYESPDSTTFYIIDQLQHNLTFQVKYPNKLQSAFVSRSKTDLDIKTQVQIRFKTLNYIPQTGELLFLIPESQFVISQTSSRDITCYQSGGFTARQNDNVCKILNKTSLLVSNICQKQQGCEAGTEISLTFVESIIKNPGYAQDNYDSITDSFGFITQYTSEIDNKTYLIDNYTQGLFAIPPLQTKKIQISNVQFSGQNTSETINLNFKLQYQTVTNVFSRDSIQIEFNQTVFNQNPIKEIRTFINSKEQQSLIITSSDSNQIVSIQIECLDQCQSQNSLEIEIQNIQNPYFIYKPQTLFRNNQFMMKVQETNEDPNTYVSSVTYNLINFVTQNLTLSPITNAQIYHYQISSVTPSSLQILFTLANNPIVSRNANITFTLPLDFGVQQQNLKCLHLFQQIQLECIFNSMTGQITIGEYFSIIGGSVIALQINGIQNPNKKTSGKLKLTVDDNNLLFAQDNETFSLESVEKSTQCQEGCQMCTVDGKCLKCTQPSQTPILEDGVCKTECSQGYFELNKVCYKCTENCQNCQTYDQCTACKNNTMLINGKCTDNDKCPTGMIQNQNKQCYNTEQECDNNCKICSLSSSYCYQCKYHQVSLNGLCISQCPDSYYQNDLGQCLKCNSLCNECRDSPSQCTKCQSGVYNQSILDESKSTCISECLTTTIEEQDGNLKCESCSPKCYTCQGTRDNCTSCYFDKETLEDLFLYENQCITTCPIGFFANLETNVCEEQPFSLLSFPPIYLASSATLMAGSLVASKFLAAKTDNSGDIAIVMLTQVEFLNRLFLLGNLWSSTKSLSFVVTGVTMLTNSFVAIYFVVMVLQPICNQLQGAMNSDSIAFKAVVGLTQISGINTCRLLTSNFMGIQIFGSKFNEIPYYNRHLEGISLISTGLSLLQLGTGVSCIFDFPFAQDSMGLGANSIILNLTLIAAQTFKYVKAYHMAKAYTSVSQI